MNKIINGVEYDTEKAHEIASWDNNRMSGDFDARAETLHVTAKGAYFSTSLGFNSSGNGRTSIFTPMTDKEALAWCEEHDCLDAAKKHFSHFITEA